MFDLSKNLSKLVVSGNYGASDTSILISGSNLQSKLPASGSGIFSVVWYNSTDYPAVYNDTNKEICRVTGFSGQTIFVERGREYTTPAIHSGTNKTHKMIVSPSARGFNNLYYFRNPEKSYYMFEDFLGTQGSIEGWAIAQSASVAVTASYIWPQQFGVWGIACGTGANNNRRLYYGVDSYVFGSGLIVFECLFNTDNLPSTGNPFGYIFGFQDSNSFNTTQGVAFKIHSGSTNYRMHTSVSNTRTDTDTSTPVTTGWHKYNIIINQTGDQADYYVDDILIGSVSGSLVPSVSTDIGFIVLREAGADPNPQPNGTGYIDYVLVYKELNLLNNPSYMATGFNYRL
jgi:hypothetical protein